MSEKLAIIGGNKTVTKNFPWPISDQTEANNIIQVLESGEWGNPDCDGIIKEVEESFAEYLGTKYALTAVNGSVTLRIALLASGVQPGDEVIVPPYTFFATVSIVLEANCVPVFVDIEDDTYNLDPEKIEAAITDKTKAIIPVHFAGLACDMDKIMAIAKKHNLTVIEDAAHAHGAEYKNKKLGSIGDAGSFSFQSSKNMTSGEGGLVTTNNKKLYNEMFSLKNCGRSLTGEWYEHFNLGCNYRITQLQAVILRAQLRRVEEQTQKRNKNGLYLSELLSKIEGIKPLVRGRGETLHSYHVFVFRYDKSKFNNIEKSDFAEILTAEGVPSFMGYPKPLYEQPFLLEKKYYSYQAAKNYDYSKVFCPVSQNACYNEGIWILQHALLGEKSDMELFAGAIKKIQDNAASFTGI